MKNVQIDALLFALFFMYVFGSVLLPTPINGRAKCVGEININKNRDFIRDMRFCLTFNKTVNPLVATGSPGTRENDDFLDTLIIDLTFRALAP